jgi:hypothetical protein
VSDRQEFLNELTALVGVHGAFLFDSQGGIKLYSSPIKLAPERGLALARTLARALTGLSTVQRANKISLDLVYDEGWIVVQGLQDGGLCILCDRQMNVSLLNLTLEQGLQTLDQSQAAKPKSDRTSELKHIAEEMLGEHAQKIINILESAGSDQADLLRAIDQVENMTRMFIDKRLAGQMAQQMREHILKTG